MAHAGFYRSVGRQGGGEGRRAWPHPWEEGATASGHKTTDITALVLVDQERRTRRVLFTFGYLEPHRQRNDALIYRTERKKGITGDDMQRERDRTQSLQSAKQGLPLFAA